MLKLCTNKDSTVNIFSHRNFSLVSVPSEMNPRRETLYHTGEFSSDKKASIIRGFNKTTLHFTQLNWKESVLFVPDTHTYSNWLLLMNIGGASTPFCHLSFVWRRTPQSFQYGFKLFAALPAISGSRRKRELNNR